MTRTEVPVVRKQVVVNVPVKQAFTVFTERFGDFKPPEHNLLAAAIAETVFEPRVGGHIYDRAVDGSECLVGADPGRTSRPARVVFSWDIGPQWQVETDPDLTSEVEVRFVAEGPDRHPGRNWSTATSTGTVPVGSRSATASTATRDGRSTWPGSPPCSRVSLTWHRSSPALW